MSWSDAVPPDDFSDLPREIEKRWQTIAKNRHNNFVLDGVRLTWARVARPGIDTFAVTCWLCRDKTLLPNPWHRNRYAEAPGKSFDGHQARDLSSHIGSLDHKYALARFKRREHIPLAEDDVIVLNKKQDAAETVLHPAGGGDGEGSGNALEVPELWQNHLEAAVEVTKRAGTGDDFAAMIRWGRRVHGSVYSALYGSSTTFDELLPAMYSELKAEDKEDYQRAWGKHYAVKADVARGYLLGKLIWVERGEPDQDGKRPLTVHRRVILDTRISSESADSIFYEISAVLEELGIDKKDALVWIADGHRANGVDERSRGSGVENVYRKWRAHAKSLIHVWCFSHCLDLVVGYPWTRGSEGLRNHLKSFDNLLTSISASLSAAPAQQDRLCFYSELADTEGFWRDLALSKIRWALLGWAIPPQGQPSPANPSQPNAIQFKPHANPAQPEIDIDGVRGGL